MKRGIPTTSRSSSRVERDDHVDHVDRDDHGGRDDRGDHDDRGGGSGEAHVVHVAAPHVQGGVSGHVLALLERRPSWARASWIIPGDRPALASVARRARAIGAAVHPIADWRGRSAREHCDWLRSVAPDLVHLHFSTPFDLVAVLEAAAMAGVPAITTDHMVAGGAWAEGSATEFARRRAASAHAAMTIADSRAVRDALIGVIGISPGAVRVIHHGVDTARFTPGDRAAARRRLGLPGVARLIGTIGLLASSKGVHLVIEALDALVRTQAPREGVAAPELVVIGEGPERPRLERLAGHGRACVRFVGWRDDVPVWLQALDALVHASENEGFPSVLLEAMASGCPVVATAVGGVPELLGGGRRGSIVAAGDAGALRQALARLLDELDQPDQREMPHRCGALDVQRERWRAGGVANHLAERLLAARRAALRFYSIARTARRVAAVQRAVLRSRNAEPSRARSSASAPRRGGSG